MIQVIAFEGLSPFIIPNPTYVKRGLLDKLDFMKCDVWRGRYISSGPQPKVRVSGETVTKFIVIGHSMGGPSAIDWCNRNAVQVDLLLTMDPRPLHQPYIKPANVKRAVNFYRGKRGFFDMQGYPVKGAENIRVNCGHTEIPFLHLAQIVLDSHCDE